MRKLLIALCLLFAGSTITYAQGYTILTSFQCSDTEDFLKTTTRVVLYGNEKYDKAIKDAMEKYWKVTKYEFVKEADLEKMKDISNPLRITFFKVGKKEVLTARLYINGVEMGAPMDLTIVEDENKNKEYYGSNQDMSTFAGRVGVYIKMFNFQIQERTKLGQRKYNAKWVLDYPKPSEGRILLMDSTQFNGPFTKEVFEANCKVKYKIVSQAEINRVISDPGEEVKYAILYISCEADRLSARAYCTDAGTSYAKYEFRKKPFIKPYTKEEYEGVLKGINKLDFLVKL